VSGATTVTFHGGFEIEMDGPVGPQDMANLHAALLLQSSDTAFFLLLEPLQQPCTAGFDDEAGPETVLETFRRIGAMRVVLSADAGAACADAQQKAEQRELWACSVRECHLI
jgi:hypothetical protein